MSKYRTDISTIPILRVYPDIIKKYGESHSCCRSFRRKIHCSIVIVTGLTALAFISAYLTRNPHLVILGKTDYTTGVRSRIETLLENKHVRWRQESNGSIRPFLRLSSRYLASTKYDLGIGYVPKVMSTSLFTTICYLENQTILEEANTRLQDVDWQTPICRGALQPQTTAELFDVLSPEHTFFQLVRHPLDRFVSAFVHLCVSELELLQGKDDFVCFGCKNELECVVRTLYRDLVNISQTDGTRFYYHWGKNGPGFYTAHFMPQTWFSDLSERYNNMEFIKYGSKGKEKELMINSMVDLLDDAGVEKRMLRNLRNYYKDDKPRLHATRGLDLPNTVRKDILKSKELVDLLEKIYHYDYEVFDYKRPVFMK